jgi:2-oxoglutarate dehydrogenase E1 component
MYQKIKDHPTVRELWAKEVEKRGIITAEEAEAMVEEVYASMEEIRKKPKDEDQTRNSRPSSPAPRSSTSRRPPSRRRSSSS